MNIYLKTKAFGWTLVQTGPLMIPSWHLIKSSKKIEKKYRTQKHFLMVAIKNNTTF